MEMVPTSANPPPESLTVNCVCVISTEIMTLCLPSWLCLCLSEAFLGATDCSWRLLFLEAKGTPASLPQTYACTAWQGLSKQASSNVCRSENT